MTPTKLWLHASVLSSSPAIPYSFLFIHESVRKIGGALHLPLLGNKSVRTSQLWLTNLKMQEFSDPLTWVPWVVDNETRRFHDSTWLFFHNFWLYSTGAWASAFMCQTTAKGWKKWLKFSKVTCTAKGCWDSMSHPNSSKHKLWSCFGRKLWICSELTLLKKTPNNASRSIW